jgi:hypothetical protein
LTDKLLTSSLEKSNEIARLRKQLDKAKELLAIYYDIGATHMGQVEFDAAVGNVIADREYAARKALARGSRRPRSIAGRRQS